ncbi:MAG TPA: hypothetical protein PJ991_08875 [Kiritimatiellia bacterium]|nr:hypothetical protein [Kiritimatiellia bacterium]
MGFLRRRILYLNIAEGRGKISVLFLASFCILHSAQAIDFNINQISMTNRINRDPVISETGLAAWMYFDTNNIISAHSEIAVYFDNRRRDLTEDVGNLFYGASKPVVHSNQLIFVANYRKSEGDITWVLREVMDRDNGDIRELPAMYEARVEGDEQVFIAIPTDATATNESGMPVVGMQTNAARRVPSGEAELWSWKIGDTDILRVTHDRRNDFNPDLWGNTIVWQKAKGWPFGWEIMALIATNRMQMTTNYYYDMGAKVHGDKIVWYGWDGFDYEIFMYDSVLNETIQITSNRFDDVAPSIWGDVIVWEGYSSAEADIYMWRTGHVTRVSHDPDNPMRFIEDDLYPRIWNNKIVWQSFDGDDFEIYLYDINRGEFTQVTANRFDDTNPEIHDDLIVWMGYYDNWDSEIFYADLRASGPLTPVRLTTNDEDDRDPKTASRRIIWVSERDNQTHIMLAEPR